jgi:hypothetical protein
MPNIGDVNTVLLTTKLKRPPVTSDLVARSLIEGTNRNLQLPENAIAIKKMIEEIVGIAPFL